MMPYHAVVFLVGVAIPLVIFPWMVLIGVAWSRLESVLLSWFVSQWVDDEADVLTLLRSAGRPLSLVYLVDSCRPGWPDEDVILVALDNLIESGLVVCHGPETEGGVAMYEAICFCRRETSYRDSACPRPHRTDRGREERL